MLALMIKGEGLLSPSLAKVREPLMFLVSAKKIETFHLSSNLSLAKDREWFIKVPGEVPQLASLKLGLPTTTQFKDGLIRLRDFPLHPPLPPKAKLILVLHRVHRQTPCFPRSNF
jgi:hypothetical protein